MAGKKIGIILAADGEREFTQALSNAKKESALLNAELKNLNTEYEGNANSLEYLSKKQEILGKQTESFQKKVNGARQGLEHAQEVSQKAAKRYDELKEALEKAQKAQEELEKTGQSGSKEYQKQVKEVEDLQKALDKQGLECQKCEGKISDWSKKLVDAETDVKKSSQALEQNAKYLKEAENAADDCAKSIDGFGKSTTVTIETVKKFSQGLMEGLAGGIAEKGLDIAADAAAKTAEAIKDSMYDLSGASSKLQATTGASTAAMTKYNAVMKQIKGNNFGESYSDVAEAMGLVIQTMGELNETDLQSITENAMTLSDTFGYDYQEQLRAVNMLMQQFGTTSEEAFNLIVQGTQQGLNKNGDLLDSINEYSVHYAQMGVSAEGFFNSLMNGTEAGTFSVDKLGDAYKEFGIRVKDTATSTDEAYELLGLNAGKMRKMFAEGGESAEKATDQVLDALMSMDDKVEQNQAGVDLFGTMWEDLGIAGVKALTNLEGGISRAKSAMEDLKEVRYSDLESAVSGLGAAIEEHITAPIAEAALPAVTGLVNAATTVINGIAGDLETPVNEIETFVESVNNANEALLEASEQRTVSIGNAETEAQKIVLLGSRLLELQGITNKTTSEKAEMNHIVELLGQNIPELTEAYDKEKGTLKLTTAEIKEYIETQQDALIMNATLEANSELIKELVEAQTELRNATNARDELGEEIELYEAHLEQLQALSDQLEEGKISEEEYAQGWQKIAAQYENLNADMFVDVVQHVESELKDTKSEYEKLGKTVETSQALVDENTAAINENAESAKELSGELKLLGLSEEETEEAVEETGTTAKKAAEKIKDAAHALVEATEDTEGFSKTVEEAMERASKAAEAGADAQRKAAKSVSETYHGYVDEIKADLQNKVSLFDKFDGGEDITTEKMNENLASQAEGIKKYRENLAKLKSAVDEEGTALFTPELLAKVEAGGLEYANVLEHMVWTLENQGEYGTEQIKSIVAQWTENLDMTEEIAGVSAANQLAYEMSVKQFGSTDADFSELTKSVDTAVAGASDAWKKLPGETKASLDAAIQTAKECGIQIPEGLADGIRSGDTTPESAIEQLNGAVEGTFNGMLDVAKELGLEVPKAWKDGIDANSADAADAFNGLLQTISKQCDAELLKQSGESNGEDYAEGIASTTEDAKNAADAITQAAIDKANEAKDEFQTAGASAAQAYYKAMLAEKTNAHTAGGETAKAVLNAITAYQNSFQTAGFNIAAGTATGIANGKYLAINEAVRMMEEAYNAAKKAADIHSPSRKFRNEIGAMIAKGTAFGIRDKASLAGKEASKMSDKVYTNAVKWLSKYKKSQKLSIENEIYYWQTIVSHTKQGTAAYNKAINKLVAAQAKDDFGVSWYTTKNNKKVKKDAETYYNEVYQAAQKYYDKLTAKSDMSLTQQKKYWTQVRNTLKKGTQAWVDAQNQINSISAKIGTVSNASSVLSAYQTYYTMSESAEKEYWDIVRKQYAAGTQERLEADQNYFEAKEKLNDKLIELEEEYADKVEEIEKTLNEKIDDLNEEYARKKEERAESIMDAFGLFDEFESESADGKTLLFNIKSQAAGYEDWMEQLEELQNKGILDEALIKELKEMGPENSAAIHALNSLSAEELQEYNAAYLKKQELSQKQAEKDTEEIKESVEQQTKDLKEQAEKDKEEAKKEYEKNVAAVKTGLSESMTILAQNVKKIAEDQTTALVAAIKGESGLKAGAASSTGDKVSDETKAAVGVTADGLPSGAKTGGDDKILKIINSYPASGEISEADLKKHSNLYRYIYENYKRKPGNKMYKQLADELGVKADKEPTAKQRNKILKKLKEKGYRSGGKNLLDDLIWMDEQLDTIGSELLVRKSDNAILTRIKPGDDVVNAETVANMAKWAQYNPDTAQTAMFQLQEIMLKQQENLKNCMSSLNLAGITKLNDLINTPASTSEMQSNTKIDRLEQLVSSMIGVMEEFLPNLDYLKERQQIVLDSGAVVGGTVSKMSNELAMRSRRRR